MKHKVLGTIWDGHAKDFCSRLIFGASPSIWSILGGQKIRCQTKYTELIFEYKTSYLSTLGVIKSNKRGHFGPKKAVKKLSSKKNVKSVLIYPQMTPF